MVRPSNPRLMAKVLEAVKHLGEAKGSSARRVLELVREGNKPPTRNLTMQVQRALKNAVTAGLLQLRSGRYKVLISLQNAVKDCAGAGKRIGNKASVAKKAQEDGENAADAVSSDCVEAGPRSRCAYCKKHKRRMSRRRRKRSNSRRRRRQTRQAKERKSRKLRRRGEEEVSNRGERRKRIAAPGTRSKSEVPERKTNPETNEDCESREAGGRRRDRSEESSSGTEGEDEGPRITKAQLSGTGRKNDTSSRRGGSKPRRSSRKRNPMVDKTVENDSEDTTRMECRDGGQELDERDADASQINNAGSRTSI